MRGSPLNHRPPAEVGPFPKLERALLSISQIPMDSGHTYTIGKRVSVIGLRFLAASRGARSVTDVSPTTIPTPRDAHNADTSPSEICAIAQS